MAVNAAELTRELEELIVALDRRVPRVERAGEAPIARDAAALRASLRAPGRDRRLSSDWARTRQRRADLDTAGLDAKDPLPDESA
jgi:hypothetical protein